MQAVRTMKISPFSQKYIDYTNKALTHTYNCLEGGYRAGKTVANVFCFARYLEFCEDKLHLVSGFSSTTARLNVSDLGGYGLSHIFGGRCKAGRYENNDCLKIQTSTGTKYVIFVGGGMSDSYKKIQGLAFGSWLSVELANLYISDDDKDFIAMALSRLTQSKDKRVWWDLNPTYSAHKVYKKYIDKFCEDPNIDMNFMRCSLFDNTSLSKEQIQSYLALYPDKESIGYQRGILGNRANSEGVIFPAFATNPSAWAVSGLPEDFIPMFASIGVDFGGNGSNTTFVCSIIGNNFQRVYVVLDDELDMSTGDVDIQVFRERFKVFLNRALAIGVVSLKYIYGDSADPVMINEMRAVLKENGLYGRIQVLGCKKHTILKRISTKAMLLAKGYWYVHKDCKYVINSTATQVWDNRAGHEDERLDNGTVDIDIADAEEYSWSTFLERLISRSNSK